MPFIYTQLRIWQDANQDGVSQAGELKTLAELGIASINVVGQASNINLGNGNTQPWSGSYTRTNGTTGDSGTPELSGSLLLASNNFFRTFTDNPPLTEASQALPQMQASGAVRDLREAMSLGTPEAQALQDLVAQFAAGTTRAAQMDVLDELIQGWGSTSSMQTSVQTSSLSAWSIYRVDTSNPTLYTEDRAPYSAVQEYVQTNPEQAARWLALERFNGDTVLAQFARIVSYVYMDLPNGQRTVVGWAAGLVFSTQQLELLDSAYDILRQSVYDALVQQTRLRPYMDAIELIIDEDGLSLDFGAMHTLLADKHAVDPLGAWTDLVEIHHFSGPMLATNGGARLDWIHDWLQEALANPALADAAMQLQADLGVKLADGSAVLTGGSVRDVLFGGVAAEQITSGDGNDHVSAGAGNDTVRGRQGQDVLHGDAGDDILYGDDGSDVLLGGEGADTLNGGAEADTLNGGLGNDRLSGGTGNNTYVFGVGDGQDLIEPEQDTTATRVNVIEFKPGVLASQITLTQVTANAAVGPIALRFGIEGTSDSITIGHFFHSDDPANPNNPVQIVRFADGTEWRHADIMARLLAGTNGPDVVRATIAGDTVHGQDGNDLMNGAGGDDVLLGEAGDDTLLGGTGNDTLDGGTGNDRLHGGMGNNTYVFGSGDGQDIIDIEQDSTPGRVNTIQIKDGVTPDQITLAQVTTHAAVGPVALRVGIAGTSDSITAGHFFHSGDPANPYNPVQMVRFADGTQWGYEDIMTRLRAGTSGDDAVTGTLAGETLRGQGGDDLLNGAGGDDTVMGEADDDILYGGAGDDLLLGGEGNDALYANEGTDTLDGGTGDDRLNAGSGNNTYLFGLGDGRDVIETEQDTTASRVNTIQFKAGVTPDQITARQVTTHPVAGPIALELGIDGTNDTISIAHFFHGNTPTNPYNPIQQVRFADGTVWGYAQLQALLLGGTNGPDDISGGAGPDVIGGRGGNDFLRGREGDDMLSGGAGDDRLYGNEGADTLDGGAGNDRLYGHTGNNTYLFGVGDGQDLIETEQDTTATRLNVLQFKAGVTASQITLAEAVTNGNAGPIALRVGIAGTSDSITIEHFFHSGNPANPYNPVQQMRFADGTVWGFSDIMARFFCGDGRRRHLARHGRRRCDPWRRRPRRAVWRRGRRPTAWGCRR